MIDDWFLKIIERYSTQTNSNHQSFSYLPVPTMEPGMNIWFDRPLKKKS